MELVTAIIVLLVGVAVFIVGMDMMSSGLRKATGKRVKRLFRKTQNSAFAGIGIGALVTAIIQSSAATSVMAIGFINAGIMTIFQGVSIMMGAYIGTTMTGILVSLSSFDISIFLVAFSFIGIVLMFFKKPLIKHIGEILCGFGLIFFGLSTMSGSLKGNEDITNFFVNLFKQVDFPLLILIIGILFTVLLQSSSAVTGIVIAMYSSGAIPFASALYIVLGATIGTCITTLIATIGANTNAKRAGFMALFIKVVAGFIALAILWIFQTPLADFFSTKFGSPEFGIAMFLVIYNVIFMFALVPFIKPIEKLSVIIIKDKEAENKKKQIKFIDDRFLDEPSIALMQTKKEISHMFELAKENFMDCYEFYVNDKEIDKNDIIEKEDSIDYINNRLSDYLIKLSPRIEENSAKKLGSYFHVINDIERIGDHAYNFYESGESMDEKEIDFSDVAKNELNEFYGVVVKMFDLSLEIFKKTEKDKLKELHELEEETDELKRKFASNHFERMQKNLCTSELSPFFSTLLSELERVSDHLTNIGYSIVNPTGDEI